MTILVCLLYTDAYYPAAFALINENLSSLCTATIGQHAANPPLVLPGLASDFGPLQPRSKETELEDLGKTTMAVPYTCSGSGTASVHYSSATRQHQPYTTPPCRLTTLHSDGIKRDVSRR